MNQPSSGFSGPNDACCNFELFFAVFPGRGDLPKEINSLIIETASPHATPIKFKQMAVKLKPIYY